MMVLPAAQIVCTTLRFRPRHRMSQPSAPPRVLSPGIRNLYVPPTQAVSSLQEEGSQTFSMLPRGRRMLLRDFFQKSTPESGYQTTGRGYPDVSMAGFNYEIVVQGQGALVSGTSASAPVFAGLISLINAKLADEGKSPVGFINPTLYKAENQDCYNDVTDGENNCSADRGGSSTCCAQGYSAVAGWDPTTGFGSWNQAKCQTMFNLPKGGKAAYLFPMWLLTLIIVGSVAGVLLTFALVCRFACKKRSPREAFAVLGFRNNAVCWGLFAMVGIALIVAGYLTVESANVDPSSDIQKCPIVKGQLWRWWNKGLVWTGALTLGLVALMVVRKCLCSITPPGPPPQQTSNVAMRQASSAPFIRDGQIVTR
mmetsp:Transcript_29904/g.76840  ORF Transcript_29904/g.76840 Transcript_29904/m.76840 type:complete len:368 (+) Transcript_29904:1134-2237(+)